MAGTIKGMTIEIGGNTAPLEQALKDTNKEIKTTQKELNEVNKALKFDPTNTELLKQKQQLLGDQIGQTKIKLDALKQAQNQLDAEMKKGGNVNQEEYRKLEREIIATQGSLDKLKKEAKECNPQLIKLQEGLKKAGEVAGAVTQKIANLTVAGIKAMATASVGAVTALGNMAIKAGQLADDLNTLSATTGLSTKQLQEFAYASDLIDVSTDTLVGSLKKLTNNMNSAKDGTGASAEAFKKLGISVTDSEGNLRNNNDVFNETIRALGKVANETERDALAMQIFGKSATDLNPLIKGGIDTLDEMAKKANDLGLVLSQEALDGANAFNDQIDILKANGRQTFQVIGSEIASQLTPAMTSLNGKIEGVIKGLTTALKEGGIEGLVQEATKQLGNLVSSAVKALPKVAELGTNMMKTLVGAIKENAVEIGSAGAELVSTLITGFYEVLPDLIETAIVLATSFVSTIGDKLPELIPVITNGLIGIADAIVNNVDLIIDSAVKLFLGLVQGLEKALPVLVGKIPEIFEKLINALIENLPMIIEAIGTIIVSIADTIGNSADTLIPALVDGIISVVNCIIDNLPMIIDAIIKVVIAIAEALVDNIDKIIDGAVQLIIGLAQGLVDAIPRIVERLPEIIMAIVNGLIALAPKLLEVAWELITSLAERNS
jgi:phage-related minor tail protein